MKAIRYLALFMSLGFLLWVGGCKNKEKVVPTWTYGEPEYYDEAGMPRWSDTYPEVKVTALLPQGKSQGEITYYYNSKDYDRVLHEVLNCTCPYEDEDDHDGFWDIFDKDDDDHEEYCECHEEEMEMHHDMHDDDHDDDYDEDERHKCPPEQEVTLSKLQGVSLAPATYKIVVTYK